MSRTSTPLNQQAQGPRDRQAILALVNFRGIFGVTFFPTGGVAMARIPRLLLRGESATYHVVSRCALPGFPLGDVEKGHLLHLVRHLSRVYFAEVLGFCLMGNHVHLVVRMHTGEGVSDEEMARRYRLYRGK
jgi:hypothetical protein